jgi:hypothetical protein
MVASAFAKHEDLFAKDHFQKEGVDSNSNTGIAPISSFILITCIVAPFAPKEEDTANAPRSVCSTTYEVLFSRLTEVFND